MGRCAGKRRCRRPALGPCRGQRQGRGGVTVIRPKAIFFDFDGVLAESEDIKTDAFHRLYAPFGETAWARIEPYLLERAGISRVVKIADCHQRFLGISLTDDELAALCEQYSADVVDRVIASDPIPGSMEFLEDHRTGPAMYVVSGTPEDELRPIVQARGLTDYFNGVFGSPRTKDAIVREVLAERGFAPGECVFIGDAPTDHRAAAETGLHFIGRVGPGRDNLFPSGTVIIEDLWELAAAIEGL